MNRLKLVVSLVILGALALGMALSSYAADNINIGAIIDRSGKTADVGNPFAMGLEDYFSNINTQGGINGKKVNLLIRDNVYDVNLAMQLYGDLKDSGVVALYGWGTAESTALSPRANSDHIAYLPGSMAGSLISPIQPYVFILTATYEDQFYALLRYAAKHPKVSGRPVTIAFAYNSSPFGKSPIKDGETIVKALGMDLVGSVIVELGADNADQEMRTLAAKQPDYLIIQETGPATIAILNSCKVAGLNSTVMGTFYSGSESILMEAKDALKSIEYIVASPLSRWYEDTPGMREIKTYSANYRPQLKEWPQTYMQGWMMGMLYSEVLQACGDSITREKFKATLESVKEFDLKGLMPPVSFSPEKHKGTNKVKIYRANIASMRFEPLSGWIE